MRDVTVGLVTALPVEGAAMRLMLDDPVRFAPVGRRSHYHLGDLPSTAPGRPHRAALTTLPRDGTRHAAAITVDLLDTFPAVECVVMVGIAGGVPGRVRLGDVVVATWGIVDYDHVYTVDGVDHLRRAIDGLSVDLHRADTEMQANERLGQHFWPGVINARMHTIPHEFLQRPDGAGTPTVHRGTIGSADRLVRDAVKRDDLVRRHDIHAVEMEASGVAVGAGLGNRSWFVVRGIADFADAARDATWHAYASLTAAAYARALFALCHPWSPTRPAVPTVAENIDSRLAIAAALGSIEQLRDAEDRRAFLAALPPTLAAAVPYNARAHLHLLNIVRTCEESLGGGEALLRALQGSVPDGSIGRARAEEMIRAHWSMVS